MKETKALKEWINEIPKGCRQKFRQNVRIYCEKNDNNHSEALNTIAEKWQVISGFFDWTETPQGIEYWIDMQTKFMSNEN